MVKDAKTILVIDDDVDFQFMISTMLERVGYDVKYLVEGRLNSVVNSAKACDMILMDVQLPGVNGVDLTKHIKSTPEIEAIPIILVTGHNKSEKLFSESKANALIKKPFSLSALLVKITELLTPVNLRTPVDLK